MGSSGTQAGGPGGDVRALAQGGLRRALAWLRGRPLKQLAAWIGALGLALTAPFGGLDEAARPQLGLVKAEQVVPTGPIDVSITRVSATTRPGQNFSEIEDGYYLLVFGTARSTSSTTLTNSELRDAVRLSGVDGLEKGLMIEDYLPAAEALKAQPMVYAVQDSTLMTSLVPELKYEVAWIWRRQGAGAPSSVDVQVQGFTWRQRVLDDYEGWLDPAPMAHLRLPVTVKPGWVRPATEGAS
ncbi:MAG: hypothetical protein LCH66_10700 [Actinobacteria bacterium]|nr:hypothetical protein [Actinomycetota bacterium]